MQLNHYAPDLALYEEITGLPSPRLDDLDETPHTFTRPAVDFGSRLDISAAE